MSSYFVRYTSSPQADLEREFSFVGYMLFSEKEAALENIADLSGVMYEREEFDLEAWSEEHDQLVGQDNVTGKWGQKRSGLCGYGPFESVEAAMEAMEAGETSGTVSGGAGAIFAGEWTFDFDIDGQDEGLTFRPTAIAEIF